MLTTSCSVAGLTAALYVGASNVVHLSVTCSNCVDPGNEIAVAGEKPRAFLSSLEARFGGAAEVPVAQRERRRRHVGAKPECMMGNLCLTLVRGTCGKRVEGRRREAISSVLGPSCVGWSD